MKNTFKIIVIAMAISAPLSSFAAAAQDPIRAADTKELSQLEAAGYVPSRNSGQYPADLQAAEMKIHTHPVSGAAAASGNPAASGPLSTSGVPHVAQPRSSFYDGA